MNDINKQKFLAELGRLLTFMYEEDRQAALAMYGKMFDDAADEQALLQFFASPTRQAVVLARSYDSKERKLQVHAQSRDQETDPEDAGETPDFVLAIVSLRAEADAKGLFSEEEEAEPQDVNQFSLFEPSLTGLDVAEGYGSPINESEAPAYRTEVPAYEPEAPAYKPEVPSYESAAPARESVSPLYYDAPDYDQAPVAAPAESPLYTGADADEPAVERDLAPEMTREAPPAAPRDRVDDFLADFSIADTGRTDVVPAAETQAPVREPRHVPPVQAPVATASPEEARYSYSPPQPPATVRKAKVGLLILFIVLATPLTLLGIGLLLILALLCLAIAVGIVSLGVIALSCVFGHGASALIVLADILVVIGASLVLLGVGLLFAWLFVWFIGGAIVGLVRAVLRLGREWCFKEVESR